MNNWTAVKDSWGRMRIDEQTGLVFMPSLIVSAAIFFFFPCWEQDVAFAGISPPRADPLVFPFPRIISVKTRFRRQCECLSWVSMVFLCKHQSQNVSVDEGVFHFYYLLLLLPLFAVLLPPPPPLLVPPFLFNIYRTPSLSLFTVLGWNMVVW